MKKILVVSCTSSSEDSRDSLKIYQSLSKLDDNELNIHYLNTRGLPEIYNKYITSKYASMYDIALFVHDDVYIDDYNLCTKLYNGMRVYDIIGLAGCKSPVIRSPALWHIMSHCKDHRGYVSHPTSESQIAVSSFGPTPDRVTLVDGLFMAVNLPKAIETGWRFNESFDFHHYDLSSCLDANQKKLKIGVVPINVIHSSPGLRTLDDPHFQKSEQKFIEMYS
jgi:hypothetical protein